MSTTADAPAATAQRSVVPALIAAMRPYQWPKNVIVFAALIFTTGDAWQPRDLDSLWPLLWRTCALFGLWSLAASATYLLNDVRNRTNRTAGRPPITGHTAMKMTPITSDHVRRSSTMPVHSKAKAPASTAASSDDIVHHAARPRSAARAARQLTSATHTRIALFASGMRC